ncbi:MAG TPA: potassium channel family protein [Ktedonobacterales bacterium]
MNDILGAPLVHVLAGVGSVVLLGAIVWEVFETIVLPRRVSRRLRLTHIYFRVLWRLWRVRGRRIHSYQRQENFLAVFGPLSLLLLLVVWASLLIVGYAGLQWALGSALIIAEGQSSFWADLYFSGTTFLTLGLGDVIPRNDPARLITVIEVGTGFGLIALVIGYLPVLYQAFSRREVSISLLDAHAGSPPTAAALLARHPPGRRQRILLTILSEWERSTADLLENYLSYSVLAYFRSQHDNQSWVAAIAMILDACALLLACEGQVGDELGEQAHYTFAMARHLTVDMAIYLRLPKARMERRLAADELATLRSALAEAGLTLGSEEEARLAVLRGQYEKYLATLARYLVMPLPHFVPAPGEHDDWESTAETD